MAVTEVAKFITVQDAWGNPTHVRPEAVVAVSAVIPGEDSPPGEELPETQHPDNPYRVVWLSGGSRLLVAASDYSGLAALGV